MIGNDRTKAYSYVRMSTAVQLKGDSARRQLQLSREYAEKHNLDLVELPEDVGKSAYHGAHLEEGGTLGSFLEAIKSGHVPRGSYLLIESFDRLSRQRLLAALNLFLAIIEAGVTIVTLIDQSVYSAENASLQNLLITLTLMSRAYEESETKSRRLREAWKSKRQNIGTKKLTKICPLWMKLSEDRSHYEVNEEKAAVVKRIFQLSSEGLGSYSIVRLLNDERVPTFGRSKYWTTSYVTKILAQRAVLGEYQPHTKENRQRAPIGQAIPDYFPRIIDDGLFYATKAARQKRGEGGGGRRGTSVANLFTHIAVCAYCGEPMHFLNKGRGTKGGTYLRCSGAVRGAGCEAISWNYSKFETSFLYFCNEVDLRSILQETETRKRTFSLRDLIASKQAERTQLNNSINDAFSIPLNSDAAKRIVAERIESISERLEEVKIEIETAEAEIAEFDVIREINEEDFRESIEIFRFPNDTYKNNIIRASLRNRLLAIVDRLEVGAGNRFSYRDLPKHSVEPNVLSHVAEEGIPLDPPHFVIWFAGAGGRYVAIDPENPMKHYLKSNILIRPSDIVTQ